jgi:hypothetical protein
MSQSDDKARYQKMEKAEILEMAVTYMKNLKSDDTSSPASNATQYYSLAYRQCLAEFQTFLGSFPGIKDEFKSNVMSYMSQRYMEMLAYASSSSQTNPNQRESMSKENEPNLTAKSQSSANKPNKNHARYSPYNKMSSPSSKKMSKSQTSHQNEENMNMMSIMTMNSSSLSDDLQNESENKFGGSCSSLDSFNGGNQLAQVCYFKFFFLINLSFSTMNHIYHICFFNQFF